MTAQALEIARVDGTTARFTAHSIDALRARLQGSLLRAGDPGFAQAALLWNGSCAQRPALIAQPASAHDVAAAVGFAREHRLLLSVKGGGHNIAGTAIADRGLTLDMTRLRDVSVDPAARLAHAGAGCLLQDVDRATQRYGLATVLGFVSEVGIAGLTLGGGLGYLTRRFGWTVDNLEEVEIVTADGSIRAASRTQNPVGPTVYGGLIAWPFARADAVLRAYRTLTVQAPRELSVWCIFLNAPPAPFVPEAWHGKRICALSVCYSGPLGRAAETLAPLRALGEPVIDLLREQPYTELQSYLDATEPKGHHYHWKTEYAAELSDELLSTWRELAAECPIPGAELGILHVGGALNERAADDGAVGNRDARFALGAIGMWPPDEPRADEFRRWIRAAWQRFRPFSTGGNYVNFQTAEEDGARVHASYGANMARLVDLKRRYDADNLFRTNRNIDPSWTAT